jgi:hypothetical protein
MITEAVVIRTVSVPRSSSASNSPIRWVSPSGHAATVDILPGALNGAAVAGAATRH